MTDRHSTWALAALSTSTMLAAFVVAGCSSQQGHGPSANNCPADANCIGVGGPVGGGTTDGGTTTDALADAEVLEAGVVDIRVGEVRNVVSFTQDPAIGTIDTEANLVAKGAQGAKFIESTVTAGTFTLAGLDNTFPLNVLYLESRATTPAVSRTVYGFPILAIGGPYDVQIPSFPETLAQTSALALGLPLPSGTTRGTATVVIQVLDDKGIPVRGVIADSPAGVPHPVANPNANPYYDDSSDGLVESATGTAGRGTIVWLGVPPGTLFTLTMRLGTGAKRSFASLPTLPDSVTFIRATFPL